MERILRGIMRYRNTTRADMVREFQKVRDNPEPKAVFFTCMDSRMIPTRFTDTHVGDMFVIRNAGNLVPHSGFFTDEPNSCEPAVSYPSSCQLVSSSAHTFHFRVSN